MHTLIENVLGLTGFEKISFHPDELKFIRSKIREQWLKRIANEAPEHLKTFDCIEMDRYHEFSDVLDHKMMWPKIHRTLSSQTLDEMLRLPTMRKISEIVGGFKVSDEEEIGYGNAYWRIVRPNVSSDVGPLHADKWFWDLGHGKMPSGYSQRIKLWLAVFCEKGYAGFRYIPHSHLSDFSYGSEFRDGMLKPTLEIVGLPPETTRFLSGPGDALLFNDRLIHGGEIGGSKTRVSIEMTLMIR